MSKTPEQLAKERVDRQMAAINLEVPDRVPNGALMFSLGGDIAAEYGGITQREFSYDYDKALEAIEKYNRDFPFDVPGAAFMGLGNILRYAFADCKDLVLKVNRTTGPIHDVLRDRYTRFPGNEIGDHATPQFVGGTFMEADEYDQFTEDPFKFIAETLVPRVIRGIETPKSAMETWTKYGVEVERYQNAVARMVSTMQEQGYGLISVGSAIAPFDLIADNLRGVTNTVLDARRRPDKLKKACEALVEPIVNYALQSKRKNAEFVFIPLHMNEYLSPTLYKELYWPTLKEVIVRLFDNGMRSLVFFEGHHEQHLETILELPRGWGIAYFEKTDIVKAKEMLKDNCCVAGGLPISLVLSGTPERIDEYIKNLFEKVKPGGGFILLPSIGAAPIGTPLENIRAVINAVEKYGYY